MVFLSSCQQSLVLTCTNMSVFNFPQIHSFPPFYTRQLHEETWQKQKDLWIETILGFYGSKRIFEIDLMDESTYQMSLFFNTSIDRNSREFILK